MPQYDVHLTEIPEQYYLIMLNITITRTSRHVSLKVFRSEKKLCREMVSHLMLFNGGTKFIINVASNYCHA